MNFRRLLRSSLGWSHQWLGLAWGLFFSILAFTGGIVTFRPQIASLLSPAAPSTSACVAHVNWTQAATDVESYVHSTINRIYAPTAPDTRYRFRMTTDRDAIFSHVIYDACTA